MQDTNRQSAPSRIETEVRRVREFLERSQFAPALAAAQALLVEVPENRDVLYMAAIALRHLQRNQDALAMLARLEVSHPNYARLYQERGHCYIALRVAAPAIEAFERAVKMSPTLTGSWQALQGLYGATGQSAAEQHAANELANLAKLPPEIVTAYSMYADNELYQAEQLVRRYLQTHGVQVEGMRLLAQIGMRMDAVEDAEVLLEKIVALAPDYDAARYDYATVLLRRHKHHRAQEELNRLLQRGPSNQAYRGLLAAVYAGFGDYEKALPLYFELLRETPNNAQLRLAVGHALKTVGRTAEAIDAYRTAAASRPRFGEAFWSLANLKTYRFAPDEIARMRNDEASPSVEHEDRYHLCFAVGKALEDAANYEESYSYYERGNALKRASIGYRPDSLERSVDLLKSICTKEFFAARSGFGSPDASPIFIVGLPRSGSTLIEQILASHGQVEATMELADIPRLVQDLQFRPGSDPNSRYPGMLPALQRADFQTLGDTYLAMTRLYRSGKLRFIDKMPNNFRHIGLIHLMLPNARIIDARRDALACCFSNFKQLFAAGQLFTYSVADLTRYHRMYLDLMAHWDEVLPGKVLRVDYEALVEDLEGNVRRLLDFCRLEFEPACLEFHKTQRDVHSASSEQVRQPLNRQGLEQWRHFEPWLGPFKDALGA